jgi:hypothetical protein
LFIEGLHTAKNTASEVSVKTLYFFVTDIEVKEAQPFAPVKPSHPIPMFASKVEQLSQ